MTNNYEVPGFELEPKKWVTVGSGFQVVTQKVPTSEHDLIDLTLNRKSDYC